MKLEATKKQKILLSVLSGVLLGYFFIHFFLLEPFQTFQQLREEKQLLNEEIEELFSRHDRLQQTKIKYYKNKYYIENAKLKLTINGSNILNLFTRKSPVSNITKSIFSKSTVISKRTKIIQFPFSITFSDQYQKVGEYLLYQESILPISHIQSIEIRPDPKMSNFLEVKLAGKVYGVL